MRVPHVLCILPDKQGTSYLTVDSINAEVSSDTKDSSSYAEVSYQ